MATYDQAVDELSAWLGARAATALAEPGNPLVADTAKPALDEMLSPAVAEAWGARLRTVLAWTGGAEEDVDEAARRLLFAAAVRLATSEVEPFPLRILRQAWHLCADAGRRPGLAIAAAAGPQTADRLLEVLTGQIEMLRSRPRDVVLDERGLETSQPMRWASRAFWSGAYDPWVRDAWLHEALQQLAPGPYLAVLKSAPRSFVHGAIARTGETTPEPALELLRHAPLAFDANGGPSEGVTAFAAIERFEASLVDRGTLDEASSPPSAAGADAVAAVIRIISERPDARWLAWAWLQRLVALRQRPNSVRRELRFALLEGLAASAPPSADPWPWIDEEEDIWRTDRVLTQALLRMVHDDASGAAQLLGDALATGRVTVTGRDPDLTPDNAEARIVGGILAAHPDPARWFDDVWSETYDRRERLRIGRQISFDNPGHVALLWGAHGVAIIGGTPAGAAFWRRVRAAAFECQNSDWLVSHDSLCWTATSLMAIVGAGLVEQGALAADEFAGLLDDVAELSLGFCRVMGLTATFASTQVLAQALDTVEGRWALRVLERAIAVESAAKVREAIGARAFAALEPRLGARGGAS